MYKVLSFFDSTLREEYREFLNQPFHIGMVGLINFKPYEETAPLFEGFRGKEMPSWIEYENDEGIIIEFYDGNMKYYISNPKLKSQKKFEFPFPKNLHEFICDCNRVALDLYWSSQALIETDVKNLLSVNDYKIYITDLLRRLGKE